MIVFLELLFNESVFRSLFYNKSVFIFFISYFFKVRRFRLVTCLIPSSIGIIGRSELARV